MVASEQRGVFFDRARGRPNEQTAARHEWKVLAVMRGEGGVGKSTVANLSAC
jgi:Mrp family chromosome partitioning ATPase